MLPSPQATCSLRQLLRQPARVEKSIVFTESARAITDLRVDDPLDTALPLLRDSLIEARDDGTLLLIVRVQVEDVLEVRGRVREVLQDQVHDLLHILLLDVDDRVRACVVRVRGLPLASLLDRDAVVLDDERDDRLRDVVHVEDRWVRVERDRVELVRVLHRDAREGVEVARADRVADLGHALGHDVLDAVLEEGGRLDGALHARGGGSALLGVVDDADDGVEGRPVRLGCDLNGEGVGAVSLGALLPGDEATVERTASRAGALARDEGEGGWGYGELVKRREGGDQCREPGGGRRETCGCGEVVVRRDADMIGRELRGMSRDRKKSTPILPWGPTGPCPRPLPCASASSP